MYTVQQLRAQIESNRQAYEEATDLDDKRLYYEQMRRAEITLRSFDVV